MNVVVEKELPKGWASATIKELVSLINGRAFKPEDWSDTGMPIVRIQNLNNPDKSFNYCNFKVDKKFLIDNGQLLFAWSGTPGTSFGAFIWNRGKAILNQHIFRIEINEKLTNKKFLLYAINQNINKYIVKAHGTAGLAHITKGMFEEDLVLLPPLNEQKRIVAKIEELFSLVDSTKDTLEKTLVLLKQYRQSILKHAFEGKLVPQDPNDEPASVLLEKIKKENPDKKFSEIISEKVLPNGWIECSFQHIITNHDSKRIPVSAESRKNMKGKYPYYGASGIIDYVNKPIFNGKYLLIGEDGANLLSRSTPIAFIAEGEFWVNNHAHILTCNGGILLEYVSYYINSKNLSQWISGTAQPKLNQYNLNKIPILLAPLNEQKEIVSKIEESFSLIEKNEILIDKLLLQYKQIKSSILKQAFEGKLVPQDPNDEPAEVLLQRIREEKKK